MNRWVSLMVSIVLLLAVSSTAMAQGPVSPQHSDPYWQASYWNNINFSGPPVLQRQEPHINYDWGLGSPAPGIVNNDHFCARWTRYIQETPGMYRFTVTSDDGIRVWLNGELIISEWYDRSATTNTVDRYLGPGHHLIVVDYYERTGYAVAKVSWAPLHPMVGTWRGEYYNNMSLSGTPALVRDDPAINFDWGWGSPAPGVITPDHFSVRWTRSVDLPAGTYRFTVTTDDGTRLYVNNHLLIDAWRIQAATTYTGDIYLPGGPIPIKLEYFENTGLATIRLSWSTGVAPPPTVPPPVGEVIVDERDAGFQRGGLATAWRTAWAGYGGSMLWTWNNDRVRPYYNWARWYPSLVPGRRYEVYVFVPDQYSTTTAARYWVSHAGGFTLRVINQAAYSNQWVSLGTYWFRGTRSDYVSLADVTYEANLSRTLAFDAVKWVPR